MKLEWRKVPSKHVTLRGLPFYGGAWHRFDSSRLEGLPDAVLKQARYPAGAIIRFASDTRTLKLKLNVESESCDVGIDVMVDGVLWRSVSVDVGQEEVELFRDAPAGEKHIELYLPGNQELSVLQFGIDVGCCLETSEGERSQLPLLFYGSSIVQGAGSRLSCMNYPAILSRQTGVEAINFGFYGAGKGEPEVVGKVLGVPAQLIVFDLGKSFGNQASEVYGNMLRLASARQPDARLVCITPIYCLRERYDAKFQAFSESIRLKFTEEASAIDGVQLVDGLQLLGPDDWRCFSEDGLHPNEWGYALIAERLAAILGL